jgi:Zn-dependent membrane protease YugP
MGGDMFEDPLLWIFVLPGLLLEAYAQPRIKTNIAKYYQVRTKDGITGGQVAGLLLESQGLRNVAIESSPGMLSDHYDPRSKTLRLILLRHKFLRKFRGKLRAHAGHRGSRAWPIA